MSSAAMEANGSSPRSSSSAGSAISRSGSPSAEEADNERLCIASVAALYATEHGDGGAAATASDAAAATTTAVVDAAAAAASDLSATPGAAAPLKPLVPNAPPATKNPRDGEREKRRLAIEKRRQELARQRSQLQNGSAASTANTPARAAGDG